MPQTVLITGTGRPYALGFNLVRRYLEHGDRVLASVRRPSEALEALRTKDQVKFMKTMKKFPSVLRTEYAYALLAEKDPEKAQKTLEVFEKIARTYPNPKEIEIERERMEAVREAAAV